MIPFTKMQGSGVDFIVLDNNDGRWSTSDLSTLAKNFSTQKIALGGEGLLVVDKPQTPGSDFYTRFFDKEGRENEVSGNGARCLASFAFERRLAPWHMRFDTYRGPMEACVEAKRHPEQHCSLVTLYMGDFDPTDAQWNLSYPYGRHPWPYHYLHVMVPHCVFPVADLDTIPRSDLLAIARSLRFDFARFPKGTNISFVELLNSHTLKVLTYERGPETFSPFCSSGAMASALAMYITYGISRTQHILSPGGENDVTIEPGFSPGKIKVQLRGEACIIARGTILDDIPDSCTAA